MTKCLITRLDVSVDNDNLPIFGGIKVHVSCPLSMVGRTRQINWSGIDGRIYVVGGGNKIAYYSGTGNASTIFTNEITIPKNRANDGSHTIAFADGDYDIIVEGKYNIKTFNLWATPSEPIIFTFDANDLLYSSHLFDISIFGSILTKPFNIENIGKYADCRGSLSYLAISRTYDGVILTPNLVSGSIEHFADFTKLKEIRISGCKNIVGSKSKLPSSVTVTDLEGTSVTA